MGSARASIGHRRSVRDGIGGQFARASIGHRRSVREGIGGQFARASEVSSRGHRLGIGGQFARASIGHRRSVQYSDSENDDDIYDDSRASFVSAVATPSLLRKIFGDDVIHVEEDDEEDDEEEEEEEEEKEDYSIWLEEPMSIKERRQKLLREMGVSGRRSIAISSRPIIESTIEVNKPVVIDLPSPVGVALSTAGSTRVRSRSDVGVSRWDPINGGLSRTCSAPPFFRRRGGDSNSETATATAWRFKFLERLQFRNGELGFWNDCSSGMASWVPGTITVPKQSSSKQSWNDCSMSGQIAVCPDRLQYRSMGRR
ncbi:hypothetical protein ZOSMA_9G01750 [Zostera marina]|uniref:Uncharacterized protein n=1 Tax=Zostera marina TaxID=29655 RepID=A0A0K9NHG2_ZOSMR|nr:hypothetical protein ZOSMA_9G01750 [Zostera marina]